MRHIQKPFTLRKHEQLQNEINDLMIAIKLHRIESDEKNTDPDILGKAKSSVISPTWENVLEILNKSYYALDEQRYNPVKY